MAATDSLLCSIDGAIAAVADANISISDDGFVRGDGAFEVLRLANHTRHRHRPDPRGEGAPVRRAGGTGKEGPTTAHFRAALRRAPPPPPPRDRNPPLITAGRNQAARAGEEGEYELGQLLEA